jgi:lipopolysaccharide export system protein LptA
MRSSLNRIAASLAATAVLAAAIVSLAQPPRSRSRTARRQETQKNQPFHFGDVTISNYQTMSGVLGVSAEAKGPNTVVDIADPKQPKVKTRLRAAVLKAFMVEGGTNEVERIEATGNVRYTSSRPSGLTDTQTLEGTASRAVYYKTKNRLVLEGPIQYDGKRIDRAGTVIQSVKGNANAAEYDEAKQIVSLDGDVNATFMAPNLKTPATLTGASDITVDLSKTPLAYDIKGGKIQFEPKESEKKKNP